jgi:hypothetical protein
VNPWHSHHGLFGIELERALVEREPLVLTRADSACEQDEPLVPLGEPRRELA